MNLKKLIGIILALVILCGGVLAIVKISNQNTEITDLKAQVADLQAQITDLQTQISDLQQQIADKEANIAELAAQVTGLEAQIADNDTTIANLGVQVADLQAQIAEMDATIADFTAQVADLEAQIAEKNATIADLEAQIVDLEIQIAEKPATTADLEAQLADLQAQLADKDAQIADLQFQLDLRDYVVTFDGGYVTVEEAVEEFEYISYMYSMYGYSMEGYEDYFKQDIMTALAQGKVVSLMAERLGLTDITEDEKAELEASANATIDTYVENYRSQFEDAAKSDEEIVSQTLDFLASYDITFDTQYQMEFDTYMQQKLFEHVADGVSVADEDVEAAYAAAVEADKSLYAEGSNYESARASGTAIMWHPEGYRSVKQVLIQFDADQSSRYTQLNSEIAALEKELAAEGEDARPAEEVQAELDAKREELKALYAELEPEVSEVIEKFNAGTPFEELISAYNDDPGMQNEPTATEGYAVSANSTMWDAAFKDGAMAIPEIGGISAPCYGMHGVYIIYYLGDITPGAADYESVKDDIYHTALDDKRNEAYNMAMDGWFEELNVTYHPENFR